MHIWNVALQGGLSLEPFSNRRVGICRDLINSRLPFKIIEILNLLTALCESKSSDLSRKSMTVKFPSK
jgi:hypothetical protein